MTETVRTTCPYCGVGCGLIVRPQARGVEIRGDPAHPANRGAICSKGAALGETLGLEGRLLRPRLRGQEVGWDEALASVARGFKRVIAEHGPDAVAFYVSGQLLTEDYYVANKLMKGFIGSANIDTNSRLCMASAVAAHKRAFGEDLVPLCYDDFELADLIVLVGSNAAWCHPVLHQKILRAREQRPAQRLVVIDPRRTPTCEIADLHLPVRPGTDVLLFNGLLAWLARNDKLDRAFIDGHTSGAPQALEVAEDSAGDLDLVARRCRVEPEVLRTFYDWFASTERVISAWSQGVNQSSSGTDKANSLINCHLATGRIGRPGMGPFSLTGQPNAMGGREVGGLATSLAAHLELEDPSHRALVGRFWDVPKLPERPGLKAVDMFEAVRQGSVKALWIMATNPIVSLPNADRARAALRRCELVVVSDCMADTDTTALAHVLLPAAAWGEKEGTVTNSDRHISRQRAFAAPPGEARPDWWIISQVACRMGFEAGFAFTTSAQIFDEHARLSQAAASGGHRAFNLEGLTGLAEQDYRELEPVPWPVRAGAAGQGFRARGTPRLLSDGRFYHPDGRARLIPTPPRPPGHELDEEYPLVLNTGRVRDQWHTMTRSGRAPSLTAHRPEPFVDMHPEDALRYGLRRGSLVRVATRWGRLVARLNTSGEIARGALFVPMHWSDANASDARLGALVNPALDPVSGEPEFKHTPARVEPFVVSWHGFILTREPIATDAFSWWACARGAQFLRYEIAGRHCTKDWSGWAHRLLAARREADWIEYEDATTLTYRAAQLLDERLEACLFISARELPSREWLSALFGKSTLSAAERATLLAAQPAAQVGVEGPLVCACARISRSAIDALIAKGSRNVQELGRQLRAGTQCGSCVPELQRMIRAAESAR